MHLTAWIRRTRTITDYVGRFWILPAPYLMYNSAGRGRQMMFGIMFLNFDAAIGATWIITGKFGKNPPSMG